jgi:predicted dehydrogenase
MVEGKNMSGSLNRKLKMGMVGGGIDAFIGAVHRKAVCLDEGVELAAGAFSSTPEKSKKSGKDLYLNEGRVYGTYKEMAEKEAALPEGERIDFVSVVTPNNTHYEISKTFLDAGINVICDKPMTSGLGDALNLVKKVEETKLVFALTHNYTGYPLVKEARNMVKTGKLGKIMKVIVEYPQDWLLTLLEKEGQKQAKWRTDPKQTGVSCCIGDIGSHAENLANYITGLEIEEVCADITTFVKGRILEDDGNVLLHFNNGAKGILYASQVSIGNENNLKIRVYGTEGSLEWHQEKPNDLYFYRPNAPVSILRRGNGYLCEAAARASRLPPGHPEAFIEAFANIYLNATDTIRAKILGNESDELMLDFPDVYDGARGMAFIETVIENGKGNKNKWTKMKRWK